MSAKSKYGIGVTMMSRPFYVVIYGQPESGKTALANALSKALSLRVAECSAYLDECRVRICMARFGVNGNQARDILSGEAARAIAREEKAEIGDIIRETSREEKAEIGDIIRETSPAGVIDGALRHSYRFGTCGNFENLGAIICGVRKREELKAWLDRDSVRELRVSCSAVKLIEVQRPLSLPSPHGGEGTTAARVSDNYDLGGLQIGQSVYVNNCVTAESWAARCATIAAERAAEWSL